jgi:ADP-ribose pyrophosphatase YjhB (NUDIX family)
MPTDKKSNHDFQPKLSKASVIRLLKSYEPSNLREVRQKRAFLDFFSTSKTPFDWDSFCPGHVTASAVILEPKFNRILLIRHRILRQWIQPGGHVAACDRSLMDTAIREVREETGIRLLQSEGRLFDLNAHEIPVAGPHPRHQHFDFRFLFAIEMRKPKAMSDAAAARWLPFDEAIKKSTSVNSKRLIQKCLNVSSSYTRE